MIRLGLTTRYRLILEAWVGSEAAFQLLAILVASMQRMITPINT